MLDTWVTDLRQEYPQQTSQYSDPQFCELLGRGARMAAGYGLTELAHVREYLEMLLRFGTTPDGAPTQSWMLEILRDPDATELRKMDRLAARLDELDPTDEEDEDAELEESESAEEEESEGAEEPDIPVNSRFDVPPDPEEMEMELPDNEEDLW